MFIRKVKAQYEELTGKDFDIEMQALDTSRVTQAYRYDQEIDAKIKLILNKLLAPSLRNTIIDRLFSELVPDEDTFCNDFYMNREELAELYSRNALGVHTYAHQPLSTLSGENLSREFTSCIAAFEQAMQKPIHIQGVSYPYGNKESTSLEVGKAAEIAGFVYGFTMERSFNKSVKKPHFLARVDTNDAPGGKSPIFSTERDVLSLQQSMQDGRTTYVND